MLYKILVRNDVKQDKLIIFFLKEMRKILEGTGSQFEIVKSNEFAEREEYSLDYSIILKLEEVEGKPESYHIYRKDGKLFITGDDVKGLAYGIQNFTEWLQEGNIQKWKQAPEIVGSPGLAVRGIDKFIMNSDDEVWWMNPSYWKDYIEMLAVSRINRLCLVTGFDTGYLSPPYPFLFSIDGFEDVYACSDQKKEEHLEALRMIGMICHDYHMDFSFAIWQQQPWESGVKRMVEGLDNQSRLCEYCRRGIQKLLYECPEIDILQFRVNHESGVGNEISSEEYWLHQIETIGEVKRSGRKVKLELRAKGMTDNMANKAKKEELQLTVSTKYCCEHAGLPYHLTRMRTQEMDHLENLNMARRYSYSDLLRKPGNYDILYRLWGNGSIDIFTWGDADYVRRFAESMALGDAKGFEVIPPLTLKGGREFDKHTGWPLFENKRIQPPAWEDERYWLFYMLFGRIGYDKKCCDSVWKMVMNKRLGENGELALPIITLSSKIVPFITSFHFPEHPQLWYWTEMSTGAALFPENNFHPDFRRNGDTYQDTPACDEGIFYSVTEFVQESGKRDGRYTPYQIYDWLNRICVRLGELLKAAEGRSGGWEWQGILLDAHMTLELAGFHAHKLMASLGLSRYLLRNDGSCLRSALCEMKIARKHWKCLSQLGMEYHGNLLFGAGMNCHRRGSWKDYLTEVNQDVKTLEKLADSTSSFKTDEIQRKVISKQRHFKVNLPVSHKAGEPLQIELLCGDDTLKKFFIRYRHTNQLEGSFHKAEMKRIKNHYSYILNAEYILPQWDLLIYFETVDENGDGVMFPGIGCEEEGMPYRLIRIEP